MGATLSFLGAAGGVTGSRFLLQTDGRRYLVDCGLFQGGRRTKEMNWEPFPIPPSQIDAVLLTHAHIDHSGYLPRLVCQGFQGPIYATDATGALLEIMLPDSAYLQEQDAAYANKKGYSRHQPALPLYTIADAQAALEQVRTVSFDQPLRLDGATVTWRPAGHILGSAIVEVDVETPNGTRRVVFSGDLGRYNDEIMKPPTRIPEADVLLVESTYGDRPHADQSVQDALAEAVNGVVERGGVLLIPAFAVGRTQQVLYHIRQLQDKGRVPDLPVFIDSPMAVEASHIYCQFGDDHNLDVNLLMDHRVCPLRCRDTRFVRDVRESKALNRMEGPAVILSASGMLSGGRILHHLKWRLPDSRNTVLFVGYQAEGTRGRRLLEGAEKIRIHGEKVEVRAHIAMVDALSAHADRDELLRWLGGFTTPPGRTFVIHGEPQASEALCRTLGEWGWEVAVARLGATVEL
ncbi:MAG TPA: MBL fold metallo-hydrolase [Chloroflexi bacterium]|nr:MBL fold metallo-hydrolase [Chloroflexota bacterium]